VIGSELQAHGVDLTFAPVLDVDYGESSVIGDRALHGDPNVIAVLAEALQAGLNAAGMVSIGKHFPGHGYVRADSHLEVPVDDRSYADIAAADLIPFQRLARLLGGIMPAHVVYPKVDGKAAGFSSVWLQKILRDKLGFDGIVFSDDLGMEGASSAGGMSARANAALNAGCDMILSATTPAPRTRCSKGSSGARSLPRSRAGSTSCAAARSRPRRSRRARITSRLQRTWRASARRKQVFNPSEYLAGLPNLPASTASSTPRAR
jgi:beta-N-acetylhexosaminidase